MTIKIYDNLILAPVKCGTRYLNKIFTDNGKDFEHTHYLTFPKVKYIIIRPPIEHLKTAIHTEIINRLHKDKNEDIFYEPINNFLGVYGSTHWCIKFYEYLYYYKNKFGDDIEIITLSNMSNLIRNLGYNIDYNSEEYNFKNYENWQSKEELFKDLEVKYPKKIKWLLDKVEYQNLYYEKLLNNKIDIKIFDNLI